MDEAEPSGQQVPVRLLGPILSPEGRVQAQTMSQPHLLGKALTPASMTQAAAEYQGHGHRLLPLSGAPVPLLQSHRAVKSTNLSIFTVLMAPGHPWVGEGWQRAAGSQAHPGVVALARASVSPFVGESAPGPGTGSFTPCRNHLCTAARLLLGEKVTSSISSRDAFSSRIRWWLGGCPGPAPLCLIALGLLHGQDPAWARQCCGCRDASHTPVVRSGRIMLKTASVAHFGDLNQIPAHARELCTPQALTPPSKAVHYWAGGEGNPCPVRGREA